MAKSLQAFREWAQTVKQCGNPGTGSYPGQCVSLVQQYLNQVFGVPYAARGNAKDFIPPGFSRVSSYRPGDIIRYGSNYGGGYGHIGLIDDNWQWLDQNGVVSLHVGTRPAPFSGIESIFRPNSPFQVKTPPPAVGFTPRNGTATALANLNVRSEPSTSASIVASYSTGQSFKYDGYSIQNGYVWLTYVGGSGARRWVSEGPFDNNPNNVWVKGGV